MISPDFSETTCKRTGESGLFLFNLLNPYRTPNVETRKRAHPTEAEEKVSSIMDTNKKDEQNEEAIIPGTTYKTIEDVAKALTEKDQLIARHGNELGALRAEKNTLLQTIEKLSSGGGKAPEPKEPQGPTYEAEIAGVDKAIDKLDPMSDNYQSELRNLIAKRTELVASLQHEKTLSAASEIFKKELNERDIKNTQQRFLEENPSFNTPEMQARIREYIAKDKTGMSDALSAFREIERDDARAELQRLAEEKAELEKMLNLQKGKNSTGKVIVKGQSPQDHKQQKVTGKDLDAGMMEALLKVS